MSRTDEATENPNDKQSPGKPLTSDQVAPTDDNGVAEDQETVGGLEETRPETATEEVDRKDARLPHDGLSPEYDEDDGEKDLHGIERSNELGTP